MKNRSWGHFAAFLFAISVSGCSAVNNGVTSIKPSPYSEYSADPSSDVGSRNNPISLGDSVVINNWRVRILSVNTDAKQYVLKTDPYSSAPLSSERFLLINVRATYIGEESGEPSSDLRFKIVGSGGNTFTKSCGLYSDTFDNNGETFSGASVSGSLCFTVDSNQVSGGTVSIQGDYSAEDRKFFAFK